MAARDIVPVPGARFEETLASASPDVLREMIKGFAQRMMDADVEVRCNAGYGEVTPDRVNSRNGYRLREWDTRAGTTGLAIPKLREGTYYPEFLEHRRRAERALASVVATSYLLGVSTRRVEKLAASLGVTGLPESQVSLMAAELDEMAEGFRSRPLDAGPYTFLWTGALTQKVREGGRTVNVHALIATASTSPATGGPRRDRYARPPCRCPGHRGQSKIRGEDPRRRQRYPRPRQTRPADHLPGRPARSPRLPRLPL
jgi:putative transposase